MGKLKNSKPSSPKSVRPESSLRLVEIAVDHISRPLQDIADSLTNISDALTTWVKIQEERFRREYPERIINEATIGTAEYHKPRTPEEEVEQEEDIIPWIGRREQALETRQKIRQEKRKSRSTPKSGD
jgi:hypothetical protein